MGKVYGKIIADQLIRGFIEKVSENEQTEHKVHFVPHHVVEKDSTTTPIRLVFDCSCLKSPNRASLKSVPPAMNDLIGILTRFRLNRYGVTTDIEKAFLQIELLNDDRDVTRSMRPVQSISHLPF